MSRSACLTRDALRGSVALVTGASRGLRDELVHVLLGYFHGLFGQPRPVRQGGHKSGFAKAKHHGTRVGRLGGEGRCVHCDTNQQCRVQP